MSTVRGLNLQKQKIILNKISRGLCRPTNKVQAILILILILILIVFNIKFVCIICNISVISSI